MFPWRMPDAWGVGARLVPLRDYLVAGAKDDSIGVKIALPVIKPRVPHAALGPERSTKRKTRSKRLCSVAGIEPISYRKIVPASAS